MEERVFHRTSSDYISDLSVTRLPVIYVFGRRTVDVESIATQFSDNFPDLNAEILLMCDTAYAHSLGKYPSLPKF